MTAVEEDAWLVVGGKGKARKPSQQQQQKQHVQQQQHLQQQHQQKAAPCGILPAGAPLNGSAAAAAAAAGAPAAALPGWDPSPATAGFTYSSNSSSRRKGGRQQQQQGSSVEQQVQRLQQQVLDIAAELKRAAVYHALKAAMQQAAAGDVQASQQQQQQQQQQQWDWSCVQQLVVYGLGSIEDSKVSRHQLALVVLLQELLPGLAQPPQLYDPAFSPLDCRLLQQMGFGVIPVNEEGRRSIEGQRTLFFLPHCEGILCDNLLAANWSPTALPQLAILGNSFATYRERWSGPPGLRPSTTRPDRLLQLVEAGVVRELPVRDHRYHVTSAFNDMSLHTFTAAAAAAAAVPGSACLFSQGL